MKGAAVPWAGEGVVTFDGAGGVSASYNTAVNAHIFTNQTTAGQYTVNSDCTASLLFTSGDAAGFTADMVIIGNGVEVFGVSTNPGNTMTFDLKKQ